MAFNYLKNVARSTAYAAPQIVKNRIPSVAALVGQLTDQSQREMSTGVLQEMRGIIKEDVFGLLKKGLDSAKQELRTGKMYQTEEEESKAFGDAMGMDESLFDNSFLEGGDFGGDGIRRAVVDDDADHGEAARGVVLLQAVPVGDGAAAGGIVRAEEHDELDLAGELGGADGAGEFGDEVLHLEVVDGRHDQRFLRGGLAAAGGEEN